MYQRIIVLVTALLASTAASASEINIQLSSDTARVMYMTEAFGENSGRLELEAGFLYNQNGDTLFNAGLLVRGESVSMPLIVSVGARAYASKFKTHNISAIAVGGDLMLSPESWGGFGAGLFFYTAPRVVSFSDADGLTEVGAYFNFQLTPQARMAVGYKEITASLKNAADVDIDKGAYFGLNLSF